MNTQIKLTQFKVLELTMKSITEIKIGFKSFGIDSTRIRRAPINYLTLLELTTRGQISHSTTITDRKFPRTPNIYLVDK